MCDNHIIGHHTCLGGHTDMLDVLLSLMFTGQIGWINRVFLHLC